MPQLLFTCPNVVQPAGVLAEQRNQGLLGAFVNHYAL